MGDPGEECTVCNRPPVSSHVPISLDNPTSVSSMHDRPTLLREKGRVFIVRMTRNQQCSAAGIRHLNEFNGTVTYEKPQSVTNHPTIMGSLLDGLLVGTNCNTDIISNVAIN